VSRAYENTAAARRRSMLKVFVGRPMSKTNEEAAVDRAARDNERREGRKAGPLLPPRKFILFADGSGNGFIKQESNVWRLYEALYRTKPDQVACYIKGVGTAG
jgi:hypothetical protein